MQAMASMSKFNEGVQKSQREARSLNTSVRFMPLAWAGLVLPIFHHNTDLTLSACMPNDS